MANATVIGKYWLGATQTTAAHDRAGHLLLHHLAVDREIETRALGIGIDPEPDDHIDQLQDDQRDNGVVHDYAGDAIKLDYQLVGVAVDQPTVAFADRGARQHAGQDRAGNAAEPVHPEGVEAVIVTERVLQPC